MVRKNLSLFLDRNNFLQGLGFIISQRIEIASKKFIAFIFIVWYNIYEIANNSILCF